MYLFGKTTRLRHLFLLRYDVLLSPSLFRLAFYTNMATFCVPTEVNQKVQKPSWLHLKLLDLQYPWQYLPLSNYPQLFIYLIYITPEFDWQDKTLNDDSCVFGGYRLQHRRQNQFCWHNSWFFLHAEHLHTSQLFKKRSTIRMTLYRIRIMSTFSQQTLIFYATSLRNWLNGGTIEKKYIHMYIYIYVCVCVCVHVCVCVCCICMSVCVCLQEARGFVLKEIGSLFLIFMTINVVLYQESRQTVT